MEGSMLIFAARSERASLSEACHEAVDFCNRLSAGIDLTVDGAIIEVRPGAHPYNLVQAHLRGAARPPAQAD
jgi:hypothetical protein